MISFVPFSSSNVPAATKALRRLLQDDAVRGQLAEEGRRNTLAYDWDRVTLQYRQIYDRILF